MIGHLRWSHPKVTELASEILKCMRPYEGSLNVSRISRENHAYGTYLSPQKLKTNSKGAQAPSKGVLVDFIHEQSIYKCWPDPPLAKVGVRWQGTLGSETCKETVKKGIQNCRRLLKWVNQGPELTKIVSRWRRRNIWKVRTMTESPWSLISTEQKRKVQGRKVQRALWHDKF